MNTTTVYRSSNVSSTATESSSRLNWLDWMKAIGIVLIAYGHFFSLFDRYVYVFSVPLFFVISGFLCRIESDTKVFWKKLWYNLVIPLLLISVIDYLIGTIKGILSGYYPQPVDHFHFLWKMSIGLYEAVGGLWFVYTLIILKIILQFTPEPTSISCGSWHSPCSPMCTTTTMSRCSVCTHPSSFGPSPTPSYPIPSSS